MQAKACERIADKELWEAMHDTILNEFLIRLGSKVEQVHGACQMEDNVEWGQALGVQRRDAIKSGSISALAVTKTTRIIWMDPNLHRE